MTEPGDARVGPSYRVLLLGPLEVYRSGERLDTSGWQRTVRTLLALLAMAYPGRRLRDEIIEVLWPDAAPEAGASNLRYVLGLLRRELDASDVRAVLSERGWLSLNPACEWYVDVTQFEQLVERGDRSALEEAVQLVRGEPLEEHRYDDWAIPLREHLRREWGTASLRLADLAQESGQTNIAIDWLQQLLDQDSLDEEALRRLLRLLDSSGRRAEALRRYTQFEEQLQEELGAPPSAETAAVAAALRDAPSTGLPREVQITDSPQPQTLPEGAYLGSIPVGTLVNRVQELDTILEQVDAAACGQGQLVLLAGEPGVGKTRLAQEVTRRLVDQGFIIIAGRCYEMEQSTAYYPFLDALGALLDALPARLQREVPHRWPYLARLLPDLIPNTLAEGAAIDEQQSLYRAVTGVVTAASEVAPVALLVDDLHWCDVASLRLLLHIVRHTRTSPVLVLATYRDVEVGRHHPLERALLDLGREEVVTRVALRRLQRQETAALVAETLEGADVPESLVNLIHGPTDGNPFFIQQVVRAMREQGDLYHVNGHWEWRTSAEVRVPESVRAAVGQRLSRLSEEAQDVLRDASLLGQTFRFEDLLGLGGRDEQVLEEALEEAGEHGLIRTHSSSEFSFDHALTRQTVAAENSARRRRRTHLAAAGTIADRAHRSHEEKRHAAQIAWHYLEAGADTDALPWSLLAGDAAEETFAHDEAELHYRTALELAGELDDRAHQAEALEKLGEVLITVSRQVEALPLEEQALDLYRSLGDLTGEGRAVTRISWVHAGLGRYEEPIEALRSAIDRLEPQGPSRVLVDLYASLTFHLSAADRVSEALSCTYPWEELARETNHDRYVPAARNARGFMTWLLGRRDEGVAMVESTLADLEAVGDLYSLSNSLGSLGFFRLEAGDIQGARPYLERALAQNTRRNDPTAIANSLTGLAFVDFLTGQWDAARALAERAVDLVGDRVDQPFTSYPLGFLGLLRVHCGEHEGIEAYLGRAIEISGAVRGAALYAQQAWAEYELLSGHPEAARDRLESVTSARTHGASDAWVYPNLARACLMMGDLDAAEATLDALRAETEGHPNRIVAADAALVEGELLQRRGRLPEAASLWSRALVDARAIGLPHLEARLMVALAEAHALRDQEDEARQSLEHALAIFERLGARPDVVRTREQLHSLQLKAG